MKDTNSVARSLHDVGLGVWFGGTLMGALGLNRAASEVSDRQERIRVANAGWARWTPVNLAAIAAHVLGSVQLTRANKARLAAQRGVGKAAALKGVLTFAALGATAYSRVLGQRVMNAGDVPVESGTDPSAATPASVSDAQRQLDVLQWAIPALTGGIVIANAIMGEQQRPKAVARGVLDRLRP